MKSKQRKRCSICDGLMEEGGCATQVYRRSEAVITVASIPAVRVCTRCQDAVLEWEVAQQVEDLVKTLLLWAEAHSLSCPVMTVVFPSARVAA